jgi:hypothetical protein
MRLEEEQSEREPFDARDLQTPELMNKVLAPIDRKSAELLPRSRVQSYWLGQ